MERRSIAQRAAVISGSVLPPHVSIMGNRFTLVDNAGARRPLNGDLDCVILDINEKMSRIYWGRDYTGEVNEGPPLCFSDNGIAPSTRSQEPQAVSCKPDREGKTGCRWSVWGSATSKLTGEEIPACQNGLKLALIPVRQEKKEWLPLFDDRGVFFLRVPPASLGAVSQYGKAIAGMPKLTPKWKEGEVPSDLNMYVTRVSFANGSTGKLEFRPVGYINQDIDALVDAIPQERVDIAIGRMDQPITGALPAPQAKQEQQPLPKSEAPKPQPQQDQPKPRGRPRKDVLTGAPTPPFEPKPNPNIVTGEDVQRDTKAREQQETKEAESMFGMQESAPRPPKVDSGDEEDLLDKFMKADFK